jgi:ribosomal protein S19E (S16A)
MWGHTWKFLNTVEPHGYILENEKKELISIDDKSLWDNIITETYQECSLPE